MKVTRATVSHCSSQRDGSFDGQKMYFLGPQRRVAGCFGRGPHCLPSNTGKCFHPGAAGKLSATPFPIRLCLMGDRRPPEPSMPTYSGSRADKRETEAHPADLPPTYLQLLVMPPKVYQPVRLQVPVSSVTAVAF